VLTIKSKECTNNGNKINPDLYSKSKPAFSPNTPPRIIAEIISAEIDSNKSAH
jgi:hypothetical protein